VIFWHQDAQFTRIRYPMNIPTTLTILRIFFVPFLVAVLVEQDLRVEWHGVVWVANEFLALGIFLVAAATDLLDGYLARRWGQITTVGTLLDPIADKLLISAALISLVQTHRLPAWMVVLIIGREFAVSGLRSIAAAEGYTIQASDLGKTKMITQVIAISMVLLSIHWPILNGFAMLWMWGVLIFGIASAIQYFRKFWRKVDDSIKHRRRKELLRIERQQKRAARAQRQAEAQNIEQVR
jgi:CDP-diacylglycerol---glycerol-3-phosphate 3-phosphatidyltransferase